MGLEAIEEIEVIAAQLCAEVFDAKFAEVCALWRDCQSLRLYGDLPAGRQHHCAGGIDRGARDAPWRGLRRALWPQDD